MKRSMIRRGAAIALSLFVAISSIMGRGVFPEMVSFADVERAAIVNATTLNVRSGAGTGFSVVDKLTNGMSVAVLGETTGSDGNVWYQIRFSGSTGAEKTGYARADLIRFPATYTNDADFEAYLTSQRFPESYKAGLRQLHAMYPNWVFTAQHTNLDWNTVIENESLVGRNLIYDGSISSWKSTADGAYNWETSTWPSFDSGSYVAASSALISYYMDPRNFLDDKYVFQFLLHSYDASAHTADGLRSMVEGTFLSGSAAVSGEYGSPGGMQGGPLGPLNAGTGTGSQSPAGSSGVSTQSPAESGTSGTHSSSGGSTENGSSGASMQGPGTQSGNATGSGSGASTEGPGTQNGNTTSGNSGASTQAPGTQNGNTTSGNSGASTQAPGTQSGNTTGGGSGVSTQAPSGSGDSGASRQAPGAAASVGGSGSSRILGGISPVIGNSHMLMTIAPGMVNGPGSAASDSASSGGSGPLGPLSGPLAGPTSGNTPSGGSTAPTADYVSIIMDAGIQSGVNPYVLAAMIIQEQGTQGTGSSVSGKVSGYAGYYNFFNIEAYRSGDMEATTRGLWYASQSGSYGRPWNSVDKSIVGGALYYGTNYVKVGQDTFYLKKFNVQGNNLYKHQYMTNIQGAASEGAKLSEAYSTQLKQTSKLEFKIPVYLNMPAGACPKPTVDGSPNNKLSGLAVDGFSITPTFNRDTMTYDLIVNSSVTEVKVSAAAYSNRAVVSGTGIISLQSGNNEIRITVKAENGDVREYVIRVVKQQNGPSYNSSIGSGVSGGSGPLGPGGGTSSQNGGSTGSTLPAGGPLSPLSSGNGSASSSAGSVSGPGGNPADSVSSEGPGSVSSGNSSGGYGPGGSNVTIVP